MSSTHDDTDLFTEEEDLVLPPSQPLPESKPLAQTLLAKTERQQLELDWLRGEVKQAQQQNSQLLESLRKTEQAFELERAAFVQERQQLRRQLEESPGTHPNSEQQERWRKEHLVMEHKREQWDNDRLSWEQQSRQLRDTIASQNETIQSLMEQLKAQRDRVDLLQSLDDAGHQFVAQYNQASPPTTGSTVREGPRRPHESDALHPAISNQVAALGDPDVALSDPGTALLFPPPNRELHLDIHDLEVTSQPTNQPEDEVSLDSLSVTPTKVPSEAFHSSPRVASVPSRIVPLIQLSQNPGSSRAFFSSKQNLGSVPVTRTVQTPNPTVQTVNSTARARKPTTQVSNLTALTCDSASTRNQPKKPYQRASKVLQNQRAQHDVSVHVSRVGKPHPHLQEENIRLENTSGTREAGRGKGNPGPTRPESRMKTAVDKVAAGKQVRRTKKPVPSTRSRPISTRSKPIPSKNIDQSQQPPNTRIPQPAKTSRAKVQDPKLAPSQFPTTTTPYSCPIEDPTLLELWKAEHGAEEMFVVSRPHQALQGHVEMKELLDLWDAAGESYRHRLSFVASLGACVGEPRTERMLEEINRLRDLCETNASIVECIRLLETTDYGKRGNYSSLSGAAVALERKAMAKTEFHGVVKRVKKLIVQWEQAHLQEFLYRGVPYLKFVAEIERVWEKERFNSRKQRALRGITAA